MKKHTILFLAANPIGTDRLALDREARAIRKELESAGLGDCFELETRWAVEPLDLLRELRRLKPTVVHFSGHGGQRAADERAPGPAPRRDIVGELGLLFEGPTAILSSSRPRRSRRRLVRPALRSSWWS
jgi:hypothetical protein